MSDLRRLPQCRACIAAAFLWFIAVSLFTFPAAAEDTVLKVGVSDFRPLVYEERDKLTGFDIDLWEKAAASLDVKYEYVRLPFEELLQALAAGTVDVGLGGISITAERERQFDFSHHYFDSGLLAAVSSGTSANLLMALKSLLNRSILLLLLSFIGFTLVCAHVLWFSERGATAINDKYFPGIFEAFWCTIATATTVGYGDVVPKKALGRIAALFVMLAGIGFFGILSAELMSVLTTLRLNSVIQSSKDLDEKTVATVAGTTSVDELRALHAFVVKVETIEEAFRLLEEKKVEAVVFDAPVIQHYIQTGRAGEASMAGTIFADQYYGIGLKSNSSLRERLNQVLLDMRKSGTYDRLYRTWFSVHE